MRLFPHGHATHPQWEMAAALVLAQLRAQLVQPGYADEPALGLLYITDHYADAAQDILDHLGAELPGVTDWAGAVATGICAGHAEYVDEPALAVMLCDLAPGQYRVFSGVAPLPAAQGTDGFAARSALLHVDGATPDVAELVAELAERSGTLFGGLLASRGATLQFARSSRGALAGSGGRGAAGVFEGGMSGVAFGADVRLLTRVTQGVRALAPTHVVDRADRNVVLELDGRDALDVLLEDLGITLDDPPTAVARLRRTLAGLIPPGRPAAPAAGLHGEVGDEVQVRQLIGLDPGRRGVAVADRVDQGARLFFCELDPQAARADLMRIGAEIRETLEPEEQSFEAASALAASGLAGAPHPARRIAGAVYVSCNGRGGAWFGAPGAELQVLRQALGDVPLVGFFAAGEIAGSRLHAYSGVLTVFVAD
ncbi:MAG: hypothetical protein RJA36_3604 [Pseudomonadota bacterium]|jgi:small ligand-binding sensory domain FIST